MISSKTHCLKTNRGFHFFRSSADKGDSPSRSLYVLSHASSSFPAVGEQEPLAAAEARMALTVSDALEEGVKEDSVRNEAWKSRS